MEERVNNPQENSHHIEGEGPDAWEEIGSPFICLSNLAYCKYPGSGVHSHRAPVAHCAEPELCEVIATSKV